MTQEIPNNNQHLNADYSVLNNNLDFLELVYQILFHPERAAIKIKELYLKSPNALIIFSIITLILATVARLIIESSLTWFIPSLIIWACMIGLLGMLAYIFRPKAVKLSDLNWKILFIMFSCAQIPYIFLGISSLWEKSMLEITIFSSLIHIWALLLSAWALNHALDLGWRKAMLLISSFIILPFLLIMMLFAIMIIITLIALIG